MARVDTNFILGFREKSLYPLATRLQRRWFALLGNRLPRSQRLYLVTISGQRFKRLVLPDAHYASSIATNLREFGAAEIYPSLLMKRENELWVEYIEGRSIARADAEVVAKLARLLALLYRRNPQLLAAERTPFNHSLHTDLRGIDVESLSANQLIGSGVAKTRVRWLGEWADRFNDELRECGAPDFQAYLPFVELCFLAFWVKSSFLEKKKRFIDPSLFGRFMREWDSA